MMKRIICILLMLCLLLLMMPMVLAQQVSVSVTGEKYLPGNITMTVTASESGTYSLICAAYTNSGALAQADQLTAELTANQGTEVTFRGISGRSDTRLFVLNRAHSPVCPAIKLRDTLIRLNKTSIDNGNQEGVTVSGSVLTITKPGSYAVTGSLDNGRIEVADSVKKRI